MNIVTPKEMAQYDQNTINSGISSQELMEKAGIESYKIILKNINKDDNILVVCGSGNNGGDGLVIARLLKQSDYKVSVIFTSNPDILKEKMSYESLNNYLKLQDLDIEILYATSPNCLEKIINNYNVIIDAIFGTGLDDRPLSDYYNKIIKIINNSKAYKISIDIPSGLNGTNGRLDSSIKANETIVIQSIKTGELLENGPDYTGHLDVVDIGIDTSKPLDDDSLSKKLLSKINLKFPPIRSKNSHKYHYGRIIIVAGSRGMLGAAALASKAALRLGAGLVTNYVAEDIYEATVSIMPIEALVETYPKVLTEYQIQDVKRDVVLFGPGLGRRYDYSGLLEYLMTQKEPIVVDADGLWMMKNSLDSLKESQAPLIITPHHGEFAQLLGISLDELKADPVYYSAKFAQEYNVIVILKNHHTLIASPEGEIWFNTTGNPGMATPGSGDVLAGMLSAILAQMDDPLEAAKAAVFYHGLAGDYYAKHFNETTLLASDIIDSIKYVLGK